MKNSLMSPFNTYSPIERLNDSETELFFLKFGSLINTMNIKKMNAVNFSLYFISNRKLFELVKEYIGCDSDEELIYELAVHYPKITRSLTFRNKAIEIQKKLKKKIKKNDRKPGKHL
jgi:hypothetical protein